MKKFFFLLVLVSFLVKGKVIKPQLTIRNGIISGTQQHLYFAYITLHNNEFLCGGAIIKENLILTAAHCFLNIREALQIYVSIHHVNQLIDKKPYRAEKMIPHPNYDENYDYVYDIGLILLTKDIPFGDKIMITMAKVLPPIGAQVKVVGFGKVRCDFENYGCQNENSDILRYASLRVVKIDKDGVIYTKGDDQNTCYGDSGGPIVYKNQVIGVVSTGENPDCTGYDIQAPVAPHYTWIQQYM